MDEFDLRALLHDRGLRGGTEALIAVHRAVQQASMGGGDRPTLSTLLHCASLAAQEGGGRGGRDALTAQEGGARGGKDALLGAAMDVYARGRRQQEVIVGALMGNGRGL